MKRVKLTVAYDGTNYCGWQVQPNAVTVEGVLNEKLTELLGEEITVTGASRTDAGVHSLGNVAVFDTETRIPADKISYALNQRLPEDIKNVHYHDDETHIRLLLEKYDLVPSRGISLAAATVRGLILTVSHKEQIGELYPQVLETLVYGACRELFK